MRRTQWKQSYSFTLSKDVKKELKRVARLWAVSESSVVEQAIVYLGANNPKVQEDNKVGV
jgi:predicted transcriptional regulator